MARRVRPPSPKHLLYLAGRASGLSARQAVVSAGYRGRPSVVVADLERRDFNGVVSAAFAEAGITLETIAAKISAGMDAETVEAFCTKSGEVVYSVPLVDHQMRHKYTVTASDLLGLSTRARQGSGEADKPKGDGVNILVLAQRFEHMSDADLEDAMQLMRVGQFEGSKYAGAVPVSGSSDNKTSGNEAEG